jgi:glucose-6-phosphate 1-dehydrogenase
MLPSHLFQLFSFVARELPTCFMADAERFEKNKVLDAVHDFGCSCPE